MSNMWQNLKHEEYSDYGLGIVEEHDECYNCNYLYEYAYGNYGMTFGKYHFGWMCSTPYNSKFFKKMNKQLKKAAHTYRQGHK